MPIIDTPPAPAKTAVDAAYDLRVQFKHLADSVKGSLSTIRAIVSEFGVAAVAAQFSQAEQAEMIDLYQKAVDFKVAATGEAEPPIS